MDDPVIWVSSEYEVRWGNTSAGEVYGPPAGTCHGLVHGDDRPCFLRGELCPLREAQEKGRAASVIHAYTDAEGVTEVFRVTCLPLEDGGGLEVHLALDQGVVRDPLVGLYRREIWREVVLREQALLQREDWPFSLLYLDVDHLGAFNDTVGRSVGDEVLRRIGRLILGCSRQADVAGRHAGEELVLFLPNTRSREALGVAERIRRGVESMAIETENGLESITVSVGAATVEAATPLGRALKLAADAAAQAKAGGRNRVVLDPSSMA
ncbi:MAG: diguanylate cyclase [Deltaproteobacteria bacterium]|nr:diguanylate cyclase [Deltaproteobacteria bacterium]